MSHEIEERIADLCLAINAMSVEGGDAMSEAAAVEWCVQGLRDRTTFHESEHPWQAWHKANAEQIEERLLALLGAIGGLHDPVAEGSAVDECVEVLRDTIRAEIEGDLRFRLPGEP